MVGIRLVKLNFAIRSLIVTNLSTDPHTEDKYAIMPVDYASPIYSIHHCLGNAVFDTEESAHSFLVQTTHNLPHLMKLLKVQMIPKYQLWRLEGTTFPYQLYPIGMHVKLVPSTNYEDTIEERQRKLHNCLTSLVGDRTHCQALQHVLRAVCGQVDPLSDEDKPFLSRNCTLYCEKEVARSHIAAISPTHIYRVVGADYADGYSLSCVSAPSSIVLRKVPGIILRPIDSFSEKIL